jgi:multiple sugar transport system ATP-binding protein
MTLPAPELVSRDSGLTIRGIELLAGIRFEHVWKLFGETLVVADLNLEAEEGEFLVFVGPSGCGKTTSLRLLAGLERPSYGTIWIGDEDVTLMSPGKRDVAMVFQSYALYPNMMVEKNLSFGPAVRGDDKRDLPRRIRETAAVLGIEDLLHRKPSELSGGQRQRVALGRALIREPRLFLLDEPLSNLDAALRLQMREELIRLHRELAKTTVYVTHDQVEAMTMGDRVAVMDHGRLLQVGTPTELYENPSDLFVASFLGTPKMNIFDGDLVTADGSLAVRALDTTIPLAEYQAGELKHVPSSRVTLGLRPTDLYWKAQAPPACSATLSGKTSIIEHLGAESFAIVNVTSFSLKARLSRAAQVKPEESIELRFDPADLYFFDRESGLSLVKRPTADADVRPNTNYSLSRVAQT